MPPLLFYIFCLFGTGLSSFIQYESGDNKHFIRLLSRSKRDVESTTLPSPWNTERPTDVSEEEDDETQHIYYNMTVYTNKPEIMKDYYVDVEEWLKEDNVDGHQNHPSLVQSYRKAAGAPVGFAFPFYGHSILNLTIATGGFCYVGDQTHSWLAATQYIAPLMANFDTVDPSASIKYASNKTKMIIAWNNVTLRDNRDAGLFNFQAHLLANGDIYFVYKDIPVDVKKISDINHPCKVGISDAYLFNHKLTNDKLAHPVKRVIHEYHRISVPTEKIASNSVVVLKALPTCLQFTDCNSCINSTLKTFNCSWCSPKNTNITAFCSDQAGLHRRRQEWVENDCAPELSQNAYCPANTTENTNQASTTTEQSFTAPETDIQNAKEQEKLEKEAKTSGGSGMAIFTVFLLMIAAFCCWVFYAYQNPHSSSGQFLIRYRPSKWQLPSSHVRYSASVHM